MKQKLMSVFIAGLFVGHLATYAAAEDHHPPLAPRSAAFEQMKQLAGHWEGTSSSEDGKPEKVSVDYKLTSGGSVVLETLFPGTDHEMVSAYHDQNGKLIMTHYCGMGNQPTMALKESLPTKLKFEFIPSGGIKETTDMYMNSVELSQPSPDKLVATWTAVQNGKLAHTKVLDFSKTLAN